MRIILLVLVIFSFSAYSHSRETQADADGDGLIEIFTLDELNMIRFNLAGTSLKTSLDDINPNSDGCPLDVCIGYELSADLNFDIDGNGTIDENDAFWNGGLGWDSIGDYQNFGTEFSAIFEGNGHSINALYQNRPTEFVAGLFGGLKNSDVRNLTLTNAQITSRGAQGILAGTYLLSDDATHHITNIEASGEFISSGNSIDDASGGLLGITYINAGQLILEDIDVEPTFEGLDNDDGMGGVIGKLELTDQLEIRNLISAPNFSGRNQLGGIIGYFSVEASNASMSVENCFIDGSAEGQIVGGFVGEIEIIRAYGNVAIAFDECHVASELSGFNKVSGAIADLSYVDSTASNLAPENTIEITNTLFSPTINFTGLSSSNTGAGVMGFVLTGADHVLNINLQSNLMVGTVSEGGASGTKGGLIGVVSPVDTSIVNTNFTATYWDDQLVPENTNFDNEAYGRTTERIQCTSETNEGILDTSSCLDGMFADYSSWDTALWNFGSSGESPSFHDFDGDRLWDKNDEDDDNDGVLDDQDDFPLDGSETTDTDVDGIGDNADLDDDNDNVPDTEDAFPTDPNESEDTDQDGIGNNADPDYDNDGVLDGEDAFPLDATRTKRGSGSLFYLSIILLILSMAARSVSRTYITHLNLHDNDSSLVSLSSAQEPLTK